MPNSLPILIVGAGPTGLTAAMELSRFGVPVRIIDKLTQFSDTSRALAVQSRTVELFQQRGLTDDMLRLGNKGSATTIYADGKTLGRIDLSLIDSRFNFILMLAQSETERILRKQVMKQGVTLETGTEFLALSSEDPGSEGQSVTATVRKADGTLEEIRAAYVIAADGAHSTLRHALDIDFPGKSLPHSYALADLHVESSLPDGELSIFLSRQGLLAIFPMGNRRFRLIATQDEQPKDAPDPAIGAMQQLYDAGSHIPARLHDMVWSSHFRINSRMLQHLRSGRIFFGGDAAHIHSPAGGQGMNTGIQDMINLCWKLALVYKGIARDELLDTYEAERLPVIKAIVSTTERATDLFNSDSPIVHTFISHIAPLVLNLDIAQRTSAGVLSETGANYRRSDLSGASDALGSLHAGDRLPDLAVHVEGLDPKTRLLDILDATRFTLLLLPGVSTTDAHLPDSALAEWVCLRQIKPDRNQTSRFSAAFYKAEWVLVRPDGYIVLAGTGDVREAISSWSSKWLVR